MVDRLQDGKYIPLYAGKGGKMEELKQTFIAARWIPVLYVLAAIIGIICLTVLFSIIRKSVESLFNWIFFPKNPERFDTSRTWYFSNAAKFTFKLCRL